MAEQGKWETISMEKAGEILEEFEAPTRKFMGIMGTISTALAVFCSLFALYGAFGSMITQVSRFMHVMLILMLTFLFYPPFRSWRDRRITADIFFRPIDSRCFLPIPSWILRPSSTASPILCPST